MSETLFRLTMEDIHSSAINYALFSNFRIRRPPFHGLRVLSEMGLANVAPECVGVSASCSMSYSGDYAPVLSQRNQGKWSAGCKIAGPHSLSEWAVESWCDRPKLGYTFIIPWPRIHTLIHT